MKKKNVANSVSQKKRICSLIFSTLRIYIYFSDFSRGLVNFLKMTRFFENRKSTKT